MDILWLLIGALGGGGATFVLQKSVLKKDAERIIKEAESKAETIQKERALQAALDEIKALKAHTVSVSSIKESKLMVAYKVIKNITGTKRIPELKLLETMSTIDLSRLQI